MGTSGADLENIVLSLGLHSGFLGIFDKHFPGFLNVNKPSFAIVNTGDIIQGGLHWIAFAFDNVTSTFFMFDPFGWSDMELYRKYEFQYHRILKSTALTKPSRCIKLVKSKEAVQCTCSAACGLFCCLFLASFYHYPTFPMRGNPIIDLVDGIPPTKLHSSYGIYLTHCNQKKLIAWLLSNSAYFRKNAMLMIHNTRLYYLYTHL
ncbi:protease [Frog adenovirus 1]|uniref:Protease n=1 Tax=Frog adenovirus 1 (strain ATCC VR-896) TaxID=114102 RepID=PRO_ADEF1|nr:protease [Frog adenovirus 1]Q9IIH4.1 RecName: Full=Protease; AltName: Full=Adenain; AltName: Full=Adenovirus protease; Short=AVP; AltName: Full=Adenovirus proteinase; AltName: Full=Endoprotease [Frog adenovirus 1]AAF86933.1 protease [Frog adenovirus 1]